MAVALYKRADGNNIEFPDYARVQRRLEDELHNGTGVESIINHHFLRIRLPDGQKERMLLKTILAEMGYERNVPERRR